MDPREGIIEPKRVLLVVNARARSGQQARDAAVEQLRRCGHEVQVPAIRSPQELSAAIARARGSVDVVAVGGGDGTLVSSIAGLLEAEVPLAILPLGTINELARTLNIPFGVEEACALVDAGRPVPIDVASVNGFWFFNEASMGLSTHVARLQTGEVKRRWGMFAIPLATLRAWRHLRTYHVEVESEAGHLRLRTVQLTIANSHRFGGVIENPEAGIDDGMLDLYSIDVSGWRDALDVVIAAARKKLPASRYVQTLRAPSFVVRTHRAHHVTADGEPATFTPAEFRIAPKAITVLVPPA